jgi:hypothetical protein
LKVRGSDEHVPLLNSLMKRWNKMHI